jgi:hypothetical protein
MPHIDYSFPVLRAASALNTSGVLGPRTVALHPHHGIDIRWGAGVSAGAFVIETAPKEDYTGTWAILQTLAWSAASMNSHWSHVGALAALRVRVSVDLVGGTADVDYTGS